MANQIVVPSTGAGAAASPQPVAFPYNTGSPAEGPKSALTFLTIAAGELSGQMSVNLSQIGMSMVQSVMVDNEANNVAIAVQAQNPSGVNFGIQPEGCQIIPIFTAGAILYLTITLASAQATDTSLAFQIFNSWVPPAQWVANLAIAGNVSATVSGVVDVSGSTVDIAGGSINITSGSVAVTGGTVTISNNSFAIAAMSSGGAKGVLRASLSNSAVSVKNSAAGCLKSLAIDNCGA